ncbi:MAG: hypothetical protein WCP97_01530 [bacterium]
MSAGYKKTKAITPTTRHSISPFLLQGDLYIRHHKPQFSLAYVRAAHKDSPVAGKIVSQYTAAF